MDLWPPIRIEWRARCSVQIAYWLGVTQKYCIIPFMPGFASFPEYKAKETNRNDDL